MVRRGQSRIALPAPGSRSATRLIEQVLVIESLLIAKLEALSDDEV